QEELKQIEQTYSQSVVVYEDLIKLREDFAATDSFDASFSAIITALSKKDFQLAKGGLTKLQQAINQKQAELVAMQVTPQVNVPVANTPPDSGYRRQTVQTPDAGSFVVDVI